MYFPDQADPIPVEKRADDRFPVQSRVVVTPLNDRPNQLDALLADVSASGLRLITSKSLEEGSRVLVELESHIALAEIRYINPRGDKFVLGAKKLAIIPRLDLPDTPTWEQKLQLLTAHQEPVTSAPEEVAVPTNTEASPPPVADLLPVPRISAPRASRPPVPFRGMPVESIAGSHPSIVLQNSHLGVTPADIPVGALIDDAHRPEQLTDIRELARDMYGIQISEGAATPQEVADVKRAHRSRLGMIAAAAVACLLAVAAAGFIWRPIQGSEGVTSAPVARHDNASSPAATPQQPANAATSDAATANTPPSASAPATAAISAVPAATAKITTTTPETHTSTGARRVSMQSSSLNWVSVCSDTREQVNKLMQNGDRLEFSFDQKAVLRLGSSGASDILIDGKSIGPVGPVGSPRVILLKPAGFEYLAGLPADGSGDCPR